MAVIEATPNVKAGKLTSGWDLTGKTTGEFINVGNRVLSEVACPAGSFLYMNIGVTQPNSVSVSGGLQVNGIPLPNTPVV